MDFTKFLAPHPDAPKAGPFDKLIQKAEYRLQCIEDQLVAIRQSIDATSANRVVTRKRVMLKPTTNVSGGLGPVVVTIDGPPSGREWLIERVAYSTTGGGTPDLSIYQNQQSDIELVGYMLNSTKGIEDPSNPILIAQGVRQVFFVFGSVANNGICQGNLQLQEFAVEHYIPAHGGEQQPLDARHGHRAG